VELATYIVNFEFKKEEEEEGEEEQ